ncbi:acylamino-acid-releasing enzyme-like isoform X2 [Rhopilema esculentum]|uniref:acylamino-acid-releasing enzyme-like isoform X2 n=1 Tax=Rhopilema esculentum TaxID=499914 RepID=UPI0031CDEAA4
MASYTVAEENKHTGESGDPFHHLFANCFGAADEEYFVARATNSYKVLSMLPKVSSGKVLSCENNGDKTQCTVSTTLSQNDPVNSEAVKFSTSTKLNIDWATQAAVWKQCCFPSREESLILQQISKDGKLKAVIRKAAKKDKPVFLLEVWSESFLQKALNLTEFDIHGDVYNDVTFSSLNWSADNRRLVYIAETKRETRQTFFQRKKGSECKDPEKKTGDKYLYEEDWGEQKKELLHSAIVVVDIHREEVSIVDWLPKHISPGQAIWGPLDADNLSLIFVGWWTEPFKLGLVYCENRRSAIFQAKFNGSEPMCKQISADGCAAYSPCISPKGSKLVFLERDEGGPHRGCERLMMYNFESGSTPSPAYDIVQTASDSEIPLYSHSLNQNCWLSSEDVVIMQTTFKASQILVMLHLSSSRLHRITNEAGCWSLLDTKKNLILASYSSPVVSDELVLGKVALDGTVCWIRMPKEQQSNRRLDDYVKWEMLTLEFYDDLQETKMESVLISPSHSSPECKSPLIIWPHGGPHSCAVASYNSYQSTFVSLGFAVLLVNYRGSTGFGESSLNGLLGKIGCQDVEDVQAFANAAIQTGRFYEDKIFVFGGSHGGFLGCHLVAKFPDFYRACSLRNPVINIAAMVEETDIPDWCYVESGIKYTQDILPNKDFYGAMLAKSPILNADKIRCPVLLLIGGKDSRVPPHQGRSLYRVLKALKKVAKMHWYPEDSHPLSQVETEGDVFINVAKWFFSSLAQNS